MKKTAILIIILTLSVLIVFSCAPGAAIPEAAEVTETEIVSNVPETTAQPAEGRKEDGVVFPAFSTRDILGNAVTESIFREKDVTMVNFWGTYCPPCLAEMPDLQKLSEKLPGNAQIIGVIIDVSADSDEDSLANGREILEKCGVTYENLLMSEDIMIVARNCQFIPTTFFFDSDGKQIGDTVIGASMLQYIRQLEKLLEGWTYEAA